MIGFIPRILIPAFLIAATVFFGRAMGLAVYQVYFRMPTNATVPQVVGQDVQEAEKLLHGLGLDVEVEETRYKATVKKDHILQQDPPAGREVRRGRKVSVVVSLGPELVAVPKVVDMSIRDAKIALQNGKLNTGKVTRSEKEKGEPEKILEQNPEPGQMVKKGTKVALVANIGDVARVKVPQFVGQPMEKVRDSITESDLHIGSIHWVLHPSIQEGNIIRQDPAMDTSVKPGSEVDFVVSAGAEFKDQALRQKTVVIHALDTAGPQDMRVTVTDSSGTYDAYDGVHYAGETVNVLVSTLNGGEYEVYINDKLLQRKKI